MFATVRWLVCLWAFVLVAACSSGGSTSVVPEPPVDPDPGEEPVAGTYFLVGSAKAAITPSQAHIDGVEETRIAGTPKVQKFNLGGFGMNPLGALPDPFGTFGEALTQPAEQTVHTNSHGHDEHTWLRVFLIESPETEEAASEQVVFISIDAVGAGNIIQDDLRAAVTAATGIPSSHIVFGQTHTHAGADLQGLWGGVPEDWVTNTLYAQAVSAVAFALQNKEHVELTLQQGDMRDWNNYRRPKRIDEAVDAYPLGSLLTAVSIESGDVVARLMQFNAHPTSVNEDPRTPHADYILGAVEQLESSQRAGSAAVYFNGPIADASASGPTPGEDKYERVFSRGAGMADAVTSFDPVEISPSLSVSNETVYLPVTNPLFLGAGMLGSFNRYYDFTGLTRADVPGIGGELKNLPQAAPYASTDVSRITLGTGENALEIVTIPGEATGTFGEWITRLAPERKFMLLGLTQNSFGYIIPEEEFSYTDASGDAGLVLPFTAYEEFISLGPLTAPLLRLEGYLPLFGKEPGPEYLPEYLTVCADDPTADSCLLNVLSARLDYVQRGFAAACQENIGEEAFCSLLNPQTNLAQPCLDAGLPTATCALLGSPGNDQEPEAPSASPLAEVAAAREVEPVVLTGALIPAWAEPAAAGLPMPYPSGATPLTDGGLEDICGELEGFEEQCDNSLGMLLGQIPVTGGDVWSDAVREAHNGIFIYPPNHDVDGEQTTQGGADINQVTAWRYEQGQWLQIPVQVDELFPHFLANGNSDFSTYSGTDQEITYAWDTDNWDLEDGLNGQATYPGREGASRPARKDPIAGFDTDDELVFMASDAGECAAENVFPPGAAPQVVMLFDSAIGNAADTAGSSLAPRCVYLTLTPEGSQFTRQHYVSYERHANADELIDRYSFCRDDAEVLGVSNTGYGANLKGAVQRTAENCSRPEGPQGSVADGQPRDSQDRFPRDGVVVTTDRYRWEASGRWMVRDIRITKADGSNGVDLIDRWKGRAFQQSPDSVISLVGFEDEQVNWEANASLLGERCGPVRCMREVWGADSGTNVTKLETFYRDLVQYRYRVRVHPIPPDGLYTSWDYNRSAMLPATGEDVEGGRYYTVLHPEGVPVDGQNDEVFGNIDGFPLPVPGAEDYPFYFDIADPTLNAPLAMHNWEQVSGKGDNGSLVYIFELKSATTLANAAIIPYYRDDACLDDGTGDDPVPRPWPGERSTDDRVVNGYADLDGSGEVECHEKQGAYAAHGIHMLAPPESDNAFLPLAVNEIDGQQWQFMVPTETPTNVAAPYANVVRTPLFKLVVPAGSVWLPAE